MIRVFKVRFNYIIVLSSMLSNYINFVLYEKAGAKTFR